MHALSRADGARPRHPRIPLMALALLGMPSPAIWAQSSGDAAGTWLDTIAVVGTRTEVSVQDNPASVSVVDQDQIVRQAPESVAEMLRDVPGVEVVDSNASGMKRISIRGESSRRVTILIDGQEITDHSTFGTPVLVDPANIERIEVLRGPSSVLYGAKAIGGVINIITKRGADRPVQLDVGAAYYTGSQGRQGWAAVSGTLGDVDYRLSVDASRHRDRSVPAGHYAPDGKLEGTSYHDGNAALHLGYAFGAARNHYLALKAERNSLDTESWTDPDSLVYPVVDFRIALPERERRKIGLFYDGKDLGPVLRKVHADLYYQTVDRIFSNDVVMRPTEQTTVGVASTSDDRTRNYGGTAQFDLALHPDHYTIVGLYYLMDDLDTAKTSTQSTVIGARAPIVVASTSRDRASIETRSAFVQDAWSFAPHFTLNAGLRYYHVRTELASTTDPARAGYGAHSDGRTVTSLGLSYAGLPSTTLRALYSEGYITPTLLQLYTDTSAGRGTNTYGNPNLSPETSRNFEIGTRYNAAGIVLDAAAFVSRSRDYIASVSCAAAEHCPQRATSAEFTHANVDRARAHGIELAAEYRLPGTRTIPYVSATWIRRQLQFSGLSTYDSGTPALSGRLGLRQDAIFAGHPVWADLYLRAASKLKETTPVAGGATTSSQSGWGTLNLAIGGTFGREDALQANLHFNNLLDKRYRASLQELPGTERNVVLTLHARF